MLCLIFLFWPQFGRAADRVFWCQGSTSGEIKRGDVDGSNVGVLLNISDGVVVPEGIAIDPDGGKMYWSDSSTNTISRSNLDGSSLEIIEPSSLSPLGIVVDTVHGKVYWTEGVSVRSIVRTNLDGSSWQSIYSYSGFGGPAYLALDVAAGKIYWTDTTNGEISRADLDGQNVEPLLSSLSSPTGIALDTNAGKIYWADQAQRIQRANLDGSSAELFLSVDESEVNLAIDLVNSRLYFTENSAATLKRVKLDATQQETVIPAADLHAPRGLALFIETPTPTATATPTVSPTPTIPVLTPDTVITEPPEVEVSGRTITIILQEFSGVVITTSTGSGALKAAVPSTAYRYDVTVRGSKKSDLKRIITKRNELTLKNLKPGNYTVTYTANLYSKRKAAKTKELLRQGKSTFEARFRLVKRTNKSPTANFSISKAAIQPRS